MSALWRAIAALPQVFRLANEFEVTPRGAGFRHDRALRALIAQATVTPFYRRMWGRQVDPERETSCRELLRKLPIIDGETWRGASQEDIEPFGKKVVRLATGGSSAEPLPMPYRPVDYRRLRAGIQATMRYHGARMTGRMLRFLPPDVAMPGGRELLGRVLHVASDAPTEERAAALLRGPWGMLRSYPWPAWRAAVLLLHENAPVSRVPYMFAGGEVLTGTVRRTLGQVLGGRVVDRYAATDWGLIGVECRRSRMHVMPSFVHLEVVLGESPAPTGVVGDVVVTNLLSLARPVVRVRTGDRAAFAATDCDCGNRAPCLQFVAGHRLEEMHLPGGGRVAWPAIDSAFAPDASGILGWQAERTGRRSVVVRVALADGSTLPEDLNRRLTRCLPGLAVDIVADETFEVAPNGKTRAIIDAGQWPA